ncbi:ABC transporter ATP-binding protein [Candidatus Trichorickettsia mobilis]|uniref:ABC transporter ATP-binding protein n=1 Tax=Candidatus Trichorickettsia mobilis TaxID=1346319 RepID=A0ABZ0UVP5_9RICK|nr:ABC-F family ATP-binding cassette domain-containing protein [Candidatus Trichorickettsia mobilis]WPY01255.1 ABC transporter ATP-binding protein [Candidatus Trichorickettsia mobilis]
MTIAYYIKQGNLNFADKIIFSDLEIYLYPGDKICLIGRNGCGKSSLMKVIFGDYELDSGEIFKDPNIKIGYLTQDIKTNLDYSIYDFVLSELDDPDSQRYQADIILDKLLIDGNLNLSNCSGGQLRRAYLAKVLVLKPDILLLDEPTNHLDITAIEWLEDFVKTYQGIVICISHDRAYLSNVTNKIWWIDRGVLRKSDQGFKYFEEWQEVVMRQEEAVLRKLNRKLEVENDWLNAGVTARRKRNQKRLADLKNLRENLKQQTLKLSMAKQRLTAIMAEEVKKNRFIIEADAVSFAFGHKKIINNFSFQVKKGEKIGIIGANGSGKSTFIKLLTKQLLPQIGKIIHGTNLEISYLDQHKTPLNPSLSLWQTLCPTGGDQIFLTNGNAMHVAGYLKRFMFDPALLNAKVATLSGGEASRLLLAKILARPGNLLIMDEPTNDLDMDSLEMLLEILSDYEGTLIMVSHDRDFLDRLVTRSLIFSREQIIDIVGGYEDYQRLTLPQISSKPLKLAPTKAAETTTNKPAIKLSYKHQRLLETIPLEVETIEQAIKSLEAQLSDHNLYLVNPDKFYDLTKELEYSQLKLDNLINEWMSIEEIQKSLK